MFFGQYKIILNSDHSLSIPIPFCKAFSGGLYITRGFEQNLLLMSEQVFQEVYQRIITLNIADPLARLLFRLVLGNAARLELNDSGNVQIPQELASLASLENDVVLLGQGDYLEIWSPDDWDKQSTALLDIDANTARFAQLNLALN